MRSRFSLVLLVAAALPAASALRAQEGDRRCSLEFTNTPSTRVAFAQQPDGTRNIFLGGGFRGNCAGQDVTLVSDSAEYYEGQSLLFLIGSVRYAEPRAKVDAERMTYFRAEERLLAEGSVVARLPSGTTMRGPSAEYFRAVPALRPRQRLVAPGRPQIQLVQRDSAGKPAEPVRVVADRVVMDGDSLVFAGGRVEITRTDIEARGDSAMLDNGREYARLMRTPSIAGKGRRPFTLKGQLIDLYSSQRQLQRVVASSGAVATSDDLELRSDTIDMRLSARAGNNTVERVFAWGASRARAISPERDIVADSLDVRLPGQRLSEVYAVRDAFAQTAPDTARLVSPERDWLRGDTIVARFDTVPRAPAARRARGQATGRAADTTARTRVRDLVARGSARSFYQLPNKGGKTLPPALNYVRGRLITVTFADNAVNRVVVTEQAAGLYLESAPDSTQDKGPAAGATPARPAPARGTRPAGRPPTPAPAAAALPPRT